MLNLHLFEKSFKDIKNIVDQFSCDVSKIRRVYSPEMQKIKIERLEQEARDSLQIEFNLVNHLIKKDREGLRRPEPTFDWQKRSYYREALKDFSGDFSDIYKKAKDGGNAEKTAEIVSTCFERGDEFQKKQLIETMVEAVSDEEKAQIKNAVEVDQIDLIFQKVNLAAIGSVENEIPYSGRYGGFYADQEQTNPFFGFEERVDSLLPVEIRKHALKAVDD